ncbi:hypothetical protein BGX27_003176, partial [Mortierella sp. AM989]
ARLNSRIVINPVRGGPSPYEDEVLQEFGNDGEGVDDTPREATQTRSYPFVSQNPKQQTSTSSSSHDLRQQSHMEQLRTTLYQSFL